MGIKSHIAAPAAALALGFFLAPPVSIAIDAIIGTVAPLSAAIGHLGFLSPAMGQPGTLTKQQSDALNAYDNAVKNFKSILGERRRQSTRKNPIPPSRTLSIWELPLRAPGALMRPMPISQVASAWGSSLPRPMAIKT